MPRWISDFCIVVALLSQLGESSIPLSRHALTLPRLGQFGTKDPFAPMPEFKYPRSELLGKISTLHTENQELKTQLTEYADKKSKSNSYLRSIETFLAKAHEARKKGVIPVWLVVLFRLLFNRDKPSHYELLLEEIRQSSCAILQLEGEVSTLEKDGIVMKDLLASRDTLIDNLQVKLKGSTKENEQLRQVLQKRRETLKNNHAITKLQDQVVKARKEIVRLTSQRDSLAEAKDKERLSYQLKIEGKEGRIERLEEELDKKQKRLIDLEADGSKHWDVTKTPHYKELKRENCQLKDETLRLMAKLESHEKDNMKRDIAEQKLFGERRRLQTKVLSLESVRLCLEKTNTELQTKLSKLMDANKSIQSMANQDPDELFRKLKQEVEEKSKSERDELLAKTIQMESKLSQTQRVNEHLKSELSALRNKLHQVKGPSMEATLNELQEWKDRTENLTLQIVECKNAARVASDERETLRIQLDAANEGKQALEATLLRHQDGHKNNTVSENLDTKSKNTQQHLEVMTKKIKDSNERNKARLEELANTRSDPEAAPFASHPFKRPAFGLPL